MDKKEVVKYIDCIKPIETKFDKTTILVIKKNITNISTILKELNLNPVLTNNSKDKDELNEKFYPLHGKELIYNPSVYINDKISLPTIYINVEKNPTLLSPNTMAFSRDVELWMEKIRHVFDVAYHNGHDSIVFEDYNTNCPTHISKIYRNVIAEYSRYFEIIVFAFENHQNYEIFKKYVL